MLILDTDLLTLVQRCEGAAYERLAGRLDEAADKQPIGVTVISYEEQMRGWLAYIAGQRNASRQVEAYAHLEELIRDFEDRLILSFDQNAADTFAGLQRSRIRIGTMDLKIASIVLTNGATLLSRNLRDFRKVPGLRVEDWTIP
jgi:tRNA(fMet)-specific endonuclease VapC